MAAPPLVPQKVRRLPRSSAVTASLAAASLLYVLLIFLPSQRESRRLRMELRDMQQRVIQSDRLAVPSKQAEDRLRSIEDLTRRAHDTAPNPSELPKIYAQISEQAKLSGVTLRKFEPQAPVQMALLQQCPVELAVEGEFSQIFDLVRRLEQLPPTIWIPRLRLEQMGEKKGKLQAELSLTIFGDLTDQID